MSISLIIFAIFLIVLNISLRGSITQTIIFNLYYGFFYLIGGLTGVLLGFGLLVSLSLAYILLNPSDTLDDDED